MTPISYANPDSAAPPIGQYSQISRTPAGAELVHIAGQLPLRADGSLVSDTFEGQAEAVFAALADLLDAAGSSMSQLAYLRTYMVRDEDYATFKTVRARVFEAHGVTDPPPATTIIVAGLVGGSLIELDGVAVVA